MSKQAKIICGVLALIVVFFILILAIYVVKKNNRNYPKPAATLNLKSLDSDKDGLSDYDEIYTYKTDPKNEDTDRDGYSDGIEVGNGGDPLSPMKDIAVETPSDEEKIAPAIIKVDWDNELLELKEESGNDYEIFYKAGVVAEGEYKGLPIYLKSVEEGPGGPTFSHIMIKNGKKISLEENEVKIEGLFDYPDKITIPEKNYSLTKGLVAYKLFPNKKNIAALFRDESLGNFYTDENGCAIAELPDHTAISYDFKLPFDVNEITFLDGKKNTENYNYGGYLKTSGCSPLLCFIVNTINEQLLIPDKRLKIAGKTDTEDLIYELNDSSSKELKDFYSRIDIAKYTYQNFLMLHPFLYWKDPLGRWVELTNSGYSYPEKEETGAEMCKPAIYLYPENKTMLNVQVFPNGGFTYTNPFYENKGWNVEANPDGRIKDLKTGKEYEYLYWEGKGLNYPAKEEGWVIKKENLEKFLDEKLALVGLNDKEISGFEEYWLKRLSSKPYYQISFLTQNEFNELAPISFYPETPETLIRVMMTARGLDEAKNIPEQHLPPTPERNGFTAVEWGGTLLN